MTKRRQTYENQEDTQLLSPSDISFKVEERGSTIKSGEDKKLRLKLDQDKRNQDQNAILRKKL